MRIGVGNFTMFGAALFVCGSWLAVLSPAGAGDAAAAKPRTISGTIKVEVDLLAGPGSPDGSTVSASQTVSIGTFNDGVAVTPASASTKVANGKARFVLSVPYRWSPAAAGDLISVSVSVSGGDAKLATYARFDRRVTPPKNGATTTLRFTGSI